MIKSFIRFGLVLFVLNQLTPCEGLRGSDREGYGGTYGSKGYKELEAETYAVIGASQWFAGQSATYRGLGISAWGIVTLIVSFILAVVGLYYFSICYPVICQKNKKYGVMGLTSVV